MERVPEWACARWMSERAGSNSIRSFHSLLAHLGETPTALLFLIERISVRSLFLFTVSICIVASTSCRATRDGGFELLPASQTGITFANTITTSDTLNELNDPYVYNGAGV